MKVRIEIGEVELRQLIVDHITAAMGDMDWKASDVKVQVKSIQNYKAEWEVADFRAVLEV